MWFRMRFKTSAEDPRPITFPPSGPYWVTGFDDTHSTIVAFVKEEDSDILKYWPEAENIEELETVKEITYSGRFPKPEWYKE